MVSAINPTGIGTAWGQIKKTLDTVVTTVTPTTSAPTPTPTPSPSPAPIAPVIATPPVVTPEPSVAATPLVTSTPPEPLTYSAPSSGPRQVTTAAPAPGATLADRLSDAGYYASPQAATVADPVATAQQQQEDSTSLTQAQLIAQAAYAIVARAGTDDRMSLIQDG